MAKKEKKIRWEVLFVVGALSLVVFAFFFIQGPNTFLGSLIHQTSEPNWDEILPHNIVKQSIPIVLLEDADGDCKVSADNFDIIIDHEYFLRGQEFAAQLNYDRESETLVLPCDKLYGEKSWLNIWYVLEEAPLHSMKFQYFVEP